MFKKRDGNKLYKVTLVNPSTDTRSIIEVAGDEYILDAAREFDVNLPHACSAGACVICTGKILEGTVDQTDHTFLREKELKAGFVLTCKACPTSDCVILTHQEDALLDIY